MKTVEVNSVFIRAILEIPIGNQEIIMMTALCFFFSKIIPKLKIQ